MFLGSLSFPYQYHNHCIKIIILQKNVLGVPLWYSQLSIPHCHCSGSGHHCGLRSVPGPGTSTCYKRSQEKKKKFFHKNCILFWIPAGEVDVLWERAYTILKLAVIEFLPHTSTHARIHILRHAVLLNIQFGSSWHNLFNRFDNYSFTYYFSSLYTWDTKR